MNITPGDLSYALVEDIAEELLNHVQLAWEEPAAPMRPLPKRSGNMSERYGSTRRGM